MVYKIFSPDVFYIRILSVVYGTLACWIVYLIGKELVNKKVAVIGFGPAGMFAALRLIELGIKPIIVERGKDVRGRRRDIHDLTVNRVVNSDSNYCFGEGGAGTFSDGKLYTRATKRGDVKKILRIFVQHGAADDILVDTHPHLGSNKLPEIVSEIRNTILRCGGEIHFESRVTDFILKDNKMLGVVLNNDKELLADSVLLATGHSARDIFSLLHAKNVLLEQKSFAMGVRIEHPQALINEMQYHTKEKNDHLPSANYSLACQVNNRGVFSFCMCPGGIIAPCATAPGEIVTNGWSPSKRNNPFANSGIVVTVEQEDLEPFKAFGPLAGLKFQESVERAVFIGGQNNENTNFGQMAPAQRLIDFVNNKTSVTLPDCSYHPGVVSAPLHQILPKKIAYILQEGFKDFGRKINGFLTKDAIIVAVESRTSSPVKIPRDRELLEHPELKGLYPCGEGAGYAGGIVSAAIDGQKCALAIVAKG